MVIAFDSVGLADKYQNSGIYNYARNVLGGFRALVKNRGDVTIRSFTSTKYSYTSMDWAPSTGFEIVNTRFLDWPVFWRAGGFTAAAALAGADLVFSPSHTSLHYGAVPAVTTIHDITPVTAPSFGRLKNAHNRLRLWNAARFSVTCITDSECSKKDLVESYNISPENVQVVYLGYDRDIFSSGPVDPESQTALLNRLGLQKPYIFHHGVLQPRKNLVRLIDACHLLWNSVGSLEFQLVLAGPLGWKYEPIFEAANKIGLDHRVIFAGALSNEELALLIKGAELCVIPSLYEGFCLPMVEAMACGTATIASNASCLPEVSGGMLRYFDPLSVEHIADTIRTVLEDKSLQQRLAENGLRRASEFSWQRCATETLNILTTTRVGSNGNR